jgi:putative RNA 2'-phosphotransferase
MPRLPRSLESLARVLTYLLRHRPDEFGLVLPEDGWLPVKRVLQALAAEPGFGFVRRHHLEQLASMLTPPQFELRGEKIRSLGRGPPHLERSPGEVPPPLLYVAIPPRVQERVWEQGLKPPPGEELLLATSPELALKFGRRRTPEPLLVTVQAQAAARAGISFTGYGENLYLAPALPREFLQLPAPAREKPKPSRAASAPPAPGSVTLHLPHLLQEPKRRKSKGEPAWKTGARALRKKRRGRG